MEVDKKFDFSGYATKNDLKCADGRVIMKNAFKHMDGKKVPLVWQHLHNDPDKILGHAILENRDDGTYTYCTFNDTPAGVNAKELVKHGDITALSIYANALKQKGTAVVHGVIREVSLVLAGANPGAFIENLEFSHGEGMDGVIDETEAIIYTGLNFTDDAVAHMSTDDGMRIINEALNAMAPEQRDRFIRDQAWRAGDAQSEVIHNVVKAMTTSQRAEIYQSLSTGMTHEEGTMENSLQHATHAADVTVKQAFNTLDETQKTAVYAIVASVLEEQGEVKHSDNEEGEGDNIMKTSVFDKATGTKENTLSHDAMVSILNDGKKYGTLKEAVLAHAADYGIENIELLFPEARAVRTTPDMISRDTTWVGPFLAAIKKTPFSRIKSMAADITAEVARAKGYITGKRKKEEVFPVLRRITTPTTVYKKQKLDRDDIVDITDFDVVMWKRGEMRGMLDEELARAALIGDGREADAEDHINTTNIRPVWTDDEIYAPKVALAANVNTLELIDEVVRARKLYKGTGTPNFYTTEETVTDMLLVRDLNQRRMYPTVADLASALRVNQIVSVEVMEDQNRILPNTTDVVDLVGILLNPSDYTMGADKGGQVSMFDDFDIDYNQYKYLIETRCSGALTKPKSAVVLEKHQAAG